MPSFVAAVVIASISVAQAGQPVQYTDEKTGAIVRNLTPSCASAMVIYQTDKKWSMDMRYMLFHGDYEGTMQTCVLDMQTGDVRPACPDGGGALTFDPTHNYAYYARDNAIYRVSIEPGSAPVKMADRPEWVGLAGGISLDSTGDMLYSGTVVEPGKRWAIVACDLKSGEWKKVAEVDFQIGHIQANPKVPRLVSFCWETGGDSPQRTWVVNVTEGVVRPFYKETYDEWVTHEVWWGTDRMAFTIHAYDEKHKHMPYGLASADLAGRFTIHSTFPAWHAHGTEDGQWLVADDFDRNIWLVKTDTNERRLLTQGHKGEGFKTHAHPSFTPDGKAVIFTSSRSGKEQVYTALIPEWETLPKAE